MKKYSAEFIGTLALVFIGCASVVIEGKFIGFAGIAFAFGLTVMAMVYAIGNVPGCHINPAITIAMLVAGKIKGRNAGFYIVAQCLGAIAGAGILWEIASGIPDYSLARSGLGQNGFGSSSPAGYSLVACLIAEVVLTPFSFLSYSAPRIRERPRGLRA